MSERDLGMALALLAEAFGLRELSPARIRIYAKGLEKVPPALLEPMAARAIATRKPRWGDLPTVAELLEDAEYVRLELHRAHPFDGCAQCDGHRGWVYVMCDEHKSVCVKRCSCFARHQQKLAQLGIGSTPLALPAAVEE